ncbi:porin [Vaginella massiliensis]|uniref:porin n=1 Tax=Vaginella massiliensis TaxID=1816680 RepID=UPI000838E930|nr:porin [Vaginella massiliensis]
MKFKFLFFFIALTFGTLQAQTTDSIKINRMDVYDASMLPYYSYGKGLGMTSPDSLYQVNIRFRMQNRATYAKDEGEKGILDGQIRRLRLRLDGYVGSPKFKYSMQLSFAPEDVGELNDGGNINIIRDAMINYEPNKNWSFGFGQTKLPGNRQRSNSSGALQLTDRSINNSEFNIDRDFGAQVQYSKRTGKDFSYTIRGAISTGEGRNWTDFKGTGLAYTGKVELFPFGAFLNDGSNFEGDVKRETTPKLMLSAAYSYNDDARRTQGQRGDMLFDKRDIQSLFLDLMFKYQGFAFQAAYMNRMADDLFTYNPEDATDFNYVRAGHGLDFQTSYIFQNNYELIGRFSTKKVDEAIHPFRPNLDQYSIGVTKYIWEHAFKLQAELTYETEKYFNAANKYNWFARIQIEIGI